MLVYRLTHQRHDEDDDFKTLGVYSSNEKASEAIERFRRIEEFKDYPNGYFCEEYTVNEDNWTTGFGEAELPESKLPHHASPPKGKCRPDDFNILRGAEHAPMSNMLLLSHCRKNTIDGKIHPESLKFIGAYDSHSQVSNAIARCSILPGFKDNPDRYTIEEYELDRDYHSEGFDLELLD